MARPESHNLYEPENEVIPGVFIFYENGTEGNPGYQACDLHIVDDFDEVVCWNYDEIVEDPGALNAALCAVAIAAAKGPSMVRKNIERHGAVLQQIKQTTQSRFEDPDFFKKLSKYKTAYSPEHVQYVGIVNVHELNGKPVVLARLAFRETIIAFNPEDLTDYVL
jgi:hypothetical protein